MFDYVIREDKINNFDIKNFKSLIGRCYKVFNELSSLKKELADILGEKSSILGCFELAVNEEEVKYELSAVKDAFLNAERILNSKDGIDNFVIKLAEQFSRIKGENSEQKESD